MVSNARRRYFVHVNPMAGHMNTLGLIEMIRQTVESESLYNEDASFNCMLINS